MNKAGTQKIETRRLVLRRYRIEDAEDVFSNWASDPEVTRYLTWPTHENISITRTVINSWIPCYEDGGYFNWIIEWKETGRVIGTIGFMWYSEANSSAEVGYSFSREFWNMGIATEALQAVISSAFGSLPLNRLEAQHDIRNAASGRVMEKCGMQREGILRHRVKNKNEYIDTVLWSVLRSDLE